MQWIRHITGLTFIFVFVVTYFTNKFVLSVLKFTFPTLFQGWQTFIGAVLLLLSGKLGWVEISRIPRSAALSWLPGSFLFVGNIYAGSRALSRMEIPFFFTLQNSSHVVSDVILKAAYGEKLQWLRLLSLCLMLLSAINLPFYDPQFDQSGYQWAVVHLLCTGAYRVFKVRHRPSSLSDLEQQYINYLFSVLFLALAAHPTGDLLGVLEFPFLGSHTFHGGCCASALLGFLLLMATVRLKSGFSLEHFGVWIFMSKVTATCLSPFIFNMDLNVPSLLCVMGSHAAEALLVYSQREAQL
ncbi:transmembrane protein 241 isoform X2 [Takifugu rubripes]|uniref:Transmembrane protein 241 n=1 Tax=Takifugu rubripes TaxID=31033 RepID=A0A674NFE7_TAKRU|nr:transmembrane protein 241 isoform X2 [Takifugu rubripes]|eukprot:XP_011616038.1 PREDICTED: transmembrane protein 241 isoform X2 [Takifugu rubripes]